MASSALELLRGISIYALCEPISNEIRYVGYSADLRRRYKFHCRATRRAHKDCWIRGLARKGMRPSLRVLAVVGDYDDAKRVEVEAIAMLRRRGLKLTNGTIGGDGAIGLRHSAEAKAKISAANAGKKLSESHKAKLRVPKSPRTASHRAKLSAAYAAMSESQRRQRSQKISAAGMGRQFSDEHRAKLRAAHIGVKRAPFTAEHRARISAAKVGRSTGPFSEERKAKFRAALKNRKSSPLSPEHKRNLSIALKAYWAKKKLAGEIK